MQRRSASAPQRCGEQLARVVDAVYSKACLGQEVGVAALTARHVEDARSDRKPKDFDYSCNFGAIPLGGEDRRVFQEVVRIEIAFPPLQLATQKNTGSR